MEELWKPVVGYEGVYSISNIGRLRRELGGQHTQAGRIARTKPSPNGYVNWVISHRGITKYVSIHRLMALAFFGPANGMTVNHKNGVKHDNRLENLEYLSAADNTRHGRKVLRRCVGERQGRCKVSDAMVLKIRAERATGKTFVQIGLELNIPKWRVRYSCGPRQLVNS